jgi:DNA topoisomerase-2
MVPTIEETYQKKNLHEHILSRPDSYIGSTKLIKEDIYVVDDTDNKISKRKIEYNPGLLKIFDEVLVNAIDHTVRDSSAKTIKIVIKDNTISVKNDGAGIPVVMHLEHKIYVPELIFGNLLTGSNYNDSEQRIVGGCNGYGGKLANIYSKSFSIETVDAARKLSYKQTFTNNMFDKSEPKVAKSEVAPYTKITFEPDFKRFGISGLTADIVALMKRRVYDTTATTDNRVSVYFNGEKVQAKEFQSYIKLYKEITEKVIYEKFEKDKFIWEYAVSLSENYNQVSFVNGISTTLGGRHVDYICGQIVKKLGDLIETKKKIVVKPSYIKDRLFLFVRATVANPSFSNQSKDTLTTPVKDLGVKVDVSDEFIGKLYKSGIVEDIISFTNYKNQKTLEKVSDGKKKTKILVPKLEDANFAGSAKSGLCSLILTEGDSAKTFAISGLSVIGRDKYGVFPLRGVVLNVREATQSQLVNNAEIINIKKILGLQQNKKYTDVSSLRYGSIIILTDADSDGIHIQGLIMNMLHTWWPELLEIKGFIRKMKTPIIKVSKKKESKEFYTMQDYLEWQKQIPNSNWDVKYYKGLGTSTAAEAKNLFSRLDTNIIDYISDTPENTNKSMLLAFEKKQADNRKEWLGTYNNSLILDQANQDVTYHDFIHKDLIHFSMYDNVRSIPSICDGLKPSQRKILYTLFNKNYKKEIKVAQLGAAVAEFSSYHHGEQSLFGAIINLAQNFVGSNNWNLLKPNGQFGTRLMPSGSDAASPRYIFTELNDVANKLFLKDDIDILKERFEDGNKIEPEFYVPVLPIILINGCAGIGTGFSTNVPCYNPDDIISNICKVIKGQPQKEMVPWYNNFKGTIRKIDTGSYVMSGIYNKFDTKSIKITELPVGVWTNCFKEYLEKLSEDQTLGIHSVINNSSETDVEFEIKFVSNEMRRKFYEGDPDKVLKMNKSLSSRNMHLFDENGAIKKYSSAEEILEEFVKIRLKYNGIRKEQLLAKYSNENEILENKIRFLNAIMDEKFVVYKRSKQDIIDNLSQEKYYKVENSYDYLTSMPIYSFSNERILDLEEKHAKITEKIKNLKSKNIKALLIDDILEIKKV